MNRMPGWGLLLAVVLPLLIFYSWSRLGGETARINLDRYAEFSSTQMGALMQPLAAHFVKQRQVALPGDVTLPPVPAKSGVRAWSVQADSTLLVELDAKVDGRAVKLRYVPLVRSATGIVYDCVSNTSAVHVGRFCSGEVLKSEADIPAQLQANAKAVLNLPPGGADMGSVVVVPANAAELDHCGFQCVKPQSCVTPRPLACGKVVDTANSRRFEMAATPDEYRGSALATRSAADATCAQALGEGFTVASGSQLGGLVRLMGGNEYWVHNDIRTEANCWTSTSSGR